MEKYNSGDVVIVKVDGREYKTMIDEQGVQRFEANALLKHLCDSGQVDLNRLTIDYQAGCFPREDYLRFYIGIGYSVCGLLDISDFEDLHIANPLFDDPE